MACTESDPWDMIQIWFWKTESTLQKIPIGLMSDIFNNPDAYIMPSTQASSRPKIKFGGKRNNSSTPTLLTGGPPARKIDEVIKVLFIGNFTDDSNSLSRTILEKKYKNKSIEDKKIILNDTNFSYDASFANFPEKYLFQNENFELFQVHKLLHVWLCAQTMG